MNHTTCKTCGRAVFSHHVDKDGNCVLCAPKPVVETHPAPVDGEGETD